MAALGASAVSLYPTDGSAEFFPNGKGDRTIITRRLKLVLTGQGGSSNTIGATALGFGKLISCTDATNLAGDLVYPAAVDPVDNVINLIGDVTLGNNFNDVTATVYITVTGTPKVLAA